MIVMQLSPAMAPDEIRVKRGVSWRALQAFLVKRGDEQPRIAYLEGTLELMSPSRKHDHISRRFVAVVEAYLDHLGLRYQTTGAWLLRNAGKAAALEPDESFVLHDLRKKRPDLAIEVVVSSGTLKKLEIYRRLRIHEVWFWHRRKGIEVHVLTPRGYEKRTESQCVPSCDFALVRSLLKVPATSDVKARLRKRLPPR
ncbi:MAG TPA: Uma2 family endonuclease [Kofleriaceae bacterium]